DSPPKCAPPDVAGLGPRRPGRANPKIARAKPALGAEQSAVGGGFNELGRTSPTPWPRLPRPWRRPPALYPGLSGLPPDPDPDLRGPAAGGGPPAAGGRRHRQLRPGAPGAGRPGLLPDR